jgi:peptide/nickel transport system substrate-binding protein
MRNRARLGLRLAAVAAAGATVIAGCSSSGSGSNATSGTGTKVSGGTLTIAEVAQTPPNYIWAYESGTVFSVTNSQFIYMMQRPLYWFGDNDQPTVDYGRSLATAPTWSADGKTVTVTLKPYKWSNGETVTGADVVFFMNIYKATEGTTAQYGGYVPPNKTAGFTFFPDNVTSYSASGQTVTFHLDKAYSHNWFLYNELAQITPLPLAWDVTASGTSDCATATGSKLTTDCTAVDKYLDTQAKDSKSWASSPIWSVVDGPWKLKTFDAASGAFTQVPNPAYSGPEKPSVAEINWLPESASESEYTALKSGTSKINVGYIPSSDAPKKSGSSYPSNPLSHLGYDYETGYGESITYYGLNYGSTKNGALFRQVYFREALQDTIDEQGIIDSIDRGWGYPSDGVVPTEPTSNFVSPAEKAGGSVKFSIADATNVLKQNGWDTSTTPATCTNPGTGTGQCGAGIAKGAKAEFAMDYSTGSADFTNQVDAMKSDASKAGIQIDLTGQTFNTVIGENVPCVNNQPGAGTAAGCNWDVLNWGGGWVFSPDYLPTGEELWSTAASSNQGSYSDPKTDQLIGATTTDSSTQAMYNYEDYLNSQYPVMFMPNTASYVLNNGIGEVSSNLHVDMNAYFQITPEDWYFTK